MQKELLVSTRSLYIDIHIDYCKLLLTYIQPVSHPELFYTVLKGPFE